MPASGDEQPVSHGGMACRHGQDRGGKDCGYCLFAWTTQTRCPHTHSRRKSSSRKLLDLKDKGRRDHTLTSAILGPKSGVHFTAGFPKTAETASHFVAACRRSQRIRSTRKQKSGQ